MPAMWRWALRLGGSTDLGTRERVAPGRAYASSPAPQARGPFIAEVRIITSGTLAGHVCRFRRDGPDGAARVRESGLGRLRGHGRGGARGERDTMVARWGVRWAAPDEVAGQTVLITILPGNQELHDVMLMPRSAGD
jgi:hypothetical protein